MMEFEGNHLSLVFDTADFPDSPDFCHQLSCLDQVTSIGIEVRKKDEAESDSSLTWKSLLHSVKAAFPSLTSLSLTCFFDITGKHTLRISELAETFQHCPKLKEVQLHGVGLSMEPDHAVWNESRPFESLKRAMEHHRNVVSVELDEIYFVQQNRPDSWLFYSQLAQAISSSPTLSSLCISSTNVYFSRPILTLSALQSLLSHSRLERLVVHHFNLWGAGSALYCAEAIRRNTRLAELALTACVFAVTENRTMGDDSKESSSLLSGLDTNRSIQHIDLTASMLPLEVAGLSAALLENRSLVSLTLAKTRMAFDPVLHGGRLCRILKSIASHPCLRELNLIDAIDIQFLTLKSNETTCDSSMIGLRAFFHAVRDLVVANPNISKVRFDPVVVRHLLETNVCVACATAIVQIGISTGLNRAQYWDLTPETSSSQQWVDAFARIAIGGEESENVLTSTIFQIVSSYPPMCIVE